MKFGAILIAILLFACTSVQKMQWPDRLSSLTGKEFYQQAAGMNWKHRDSFAVVQILAGNIPSFLKKFVPIKVSIHDSVGNKSISAEYYVSPDYLSVGTDNNWARLCLTPMAAQRVADSLNCFLPTRKMVDDIYRMAAVKLEPVPLYAFRDSTPIMWHHHLIIEGQREKKQGLIAGIKKDVVISGMISRDPKPNRVAIYGWHKPDGKPIQPLYTGHVNWYVDYSHGARLVYRMIKIEGKWMDYIDVLKDPVLQKLICNETWCDFFRYPTK